eukprot:7297860-Alexandrium_andersonii.AAC.1
MRLACVMLNSQYSSSAPPRSCMTRIGSSNARMCRSVGFCQEGAASKGAVVFALIAYNVGAQGQRESVLGGDEPDVTGALVPVEEGGAIPVPGELGGLEGTDQVCAGQLAPVFCAHARHCRCSQARRIGLQHCVIAQVLALCLGQLLWGICSDPG